MAINDTKNIVPRGNGEGRIGSTTKGWAEGHFTDVTASSATQGGKIVLAANDGAVMGDDHRLGVIEFKAAEDGASTMSTGARIQSIARDAWDGSNNDADLEFYTTDGTTESKVLILDASKNATFAGDIQVGGGDVFGPTDGDLNIESDGNMTFNIDADDDESTQSFTFKDNAVDCLQISQAGVLTAAGAIGGVNYRTIYVDAGAMVPSVTSGAQAVTTEHATNDVMGDSFAFDTSADEYVQFKLVMPEQWNSSTIKAKFYWHPASSTTTSHDVTWAIQATAHADGGTIDSAFGTAVTINDEVLGTAAARIHLTAATGAMTVAGTPGVSADEIVFFRIYRDVSADDLNEDAHLLGVSLQYQETATSDGAW